MMTKSSDGELVKKTNIFQKVSGQRLMTLMHKCLA